MGRYKQAILTQHVNTCAGASSGVTGHTGVKSFPAAATSTWRTDALGELAGTDQSEDERAVKHRELFVPRPWGGMDRQKEGLTRS